MKTLLTRRIFASDEENDNGSTSHAYAETKTNRKTTSNQKTSTRKKTTKPKRTTKRKTPPAKIKTPVTQEAEKAEDEPTSQKTQQKESLPGKPMTDEEWLQAELAREEEKAKEKATSSLQQSSNQNSSKSRSSTQKTGNITRIDQAHKANNQKPETNQVDFGDMEELDPEMLKGLSKRERRKLKQQFRAKQREKNTSS